MADFLADFLYWVAMFSMVGISVFFVIVGVPLLVGLLIIGFLPDETNKEKDEMVNSA